MTAPSVLVSAGASGIGLAIARRFLAAGAAVAICDIDAVALEAAGREYPSLLCGQLDVADSQAVNAFVGQVAQRRGGIDVLVNNAGLAGEVAALEDLTDDGWRKTFEVNVHGAFFMLRAVTPLMRDNGGGAVINISTGSVLTLPLQRSPYIASKWALEGLTRAAARELGPQGIRVNAIRPGFVDSERMRGIIERQAAAAGTSAAALEAKYCEYISMRSKIQPEEIGDMAVFLGSDGARHVTGQLIAVDGNIEWE